MSAGHCDTKMVSAAATVLILSCYCVLHVASSANECVRGESFWCSSFENAKECSAIKHCAATVWKNDIQNKLDTSDFKSCVNTVNEIKDILKDQFSKDSIKTFLKERLCSSYEKYENICQSLVDLHADVVVDLLRSEIDPDSMCQFFQASTFPATTIQEFYQSEAESPKCKMCKVVIDALKKLVGSHATKEKVEEELKKVCDVVPKLFRSECKDLVRKYADEIVDLILKNIHTDEICRKIHMCLSVSIAPADEENSRVVNAVASGDEEVEKDLKCKVCKIVIDKLKKMAGKEATKEIIERELAMVCGKVPGIFRSLCKDLVKKYANKIVELILKKVDTQKICREIHMCMSRSCPEGEGEVVSECEVCKVSVTALEGLLGSDATVENIEVVVSRVCLLLPCHYRMQCFGLVEEFGALIVKSFVNQVKPGDICGLLNQCNVEEQQTSRYKCIFGPDFWCSSPDNVKLCQAEDHCKKFVWV